LFRALQIRPSAPSRVARCRSSRLRRRRLLDLGDDLVRHLGALAAAVSIAAEIVHHHLRALAREEQRVLAAIPPPDPVMIATFPFEQAHDASV